MSTQKVLHLMQMYFDNTITELQKEELSKWIIESKNNEELIALLEKVWEGYLPHNKIPVDVSDKILAELFKKNPVEEVIEPASQVISIRSSYRWWKAAVAAASIIFIVGAYLWFAPLQETFTAKTLPQKTQIINDILPGGQKAILTLSNGTQIPLDSVANGKLAQQGNAQVIKLSNGEISYKPNGAFSGESLYNTISTPIGGLYQLILPDASKVWLNAASSIRFPTEFAGRERRVEIKGEAYFEIAKNAEKPFIVNISHAAEVKVLGTHFNVNAYENENIIKTTLLEGVISISQGKNNSILKPGQQAQINKTGIIKNIDADIEEAMAWKNGNFQFNSTGLEAVLRQAARWYNLEIEYEGAVPSDRFTGKIPRSVNLSKLLKWMEWSDIHFKLEGNKLIIMPS